MAGPYGNFPLTQREWHELAAAMASQPSPWPTPAAPNGAPAANPFIPNPQLVKEEREH